MQTIEIPVAENVSFQPQLKDAPSLQDLTPATRRLVTIPLGQLKDELPFYNSRGVMIAVQALEFLQAQPPCETPHKELRRLRRMRHLRHWIAKQEKEAA